MIIYKGSTGLGICSKTWHKSFRMSISTQKSQEKIYKVVKFEREPCRSQKTLTNRTFKKNIKCLKWNEFIFIVCFRKFKFETLFMKSFHGFTPSNLALCQNGNFNFCGALQFFFISMWIVISALTWQICVFWWAFSKLKRVQSWTVRPGERVDGVAWSTFQDADSNAIVCTRWYGCFRSASQRFERSPNWLSLKVWK